jgi:hypothetical protein
MRLESKLGAKLVFLEPMWLRGEKDSSTSLKFIPIGAR